MYKIIELLRDTLSIVQRKIKINTLLQKKRENDNI